MRTIAAPALLAVVLAVGSAGAQTGAERALAEGLFQDGRSLLAAGNVPEACKKFAASYRIDPAGGTLMNLASCHEREGKTATAWAEFKEALVAASRANNQVRQQEAQGRIAGLERRLARVILAPPPGPAVAGLEIRIDNVPVDADGRSALPVDPGPHTVTATAPGYRSWKAEVLARESATATLQVAALEAGASNPPPPVAPPPSGPVPVPTAEATSRPSSWHVPVGGTLVGLGGAGLIVGAVAGALVLSQHSSLASSCPGGVCPSTDSSTLSSYHAKSTASTAGFVVGGALAVGGIVILVTTPKAAERTGSMGIVVGAGDVALRGAF